MPDHAELVRIAEQAEAALLDLRSLGMHPERLAKIEAFEGSWHPSRALAALAVIEAAEALFEEEYREEWDLRPLVSALEIWNAMNGQVSE